MKNLSKLFKKNKQALDPKEQFFREIEIEFLIHELKDPISVIENSLLSLLGKDKKHGPISVPQEKIIRRTLRNSQKARDMLNGLLEIGQSEAGRFESCLFQPVKSTYSAILDSIETMTGVIIDHFIDDKSKEEILRFFAEQGVELEISPDVIDIEMLQDEIRFRRIVGNLIKNAIYHRQERVDIRIGLENDRLFVDITDDGPGIESKHHEKIFQRYVQVKETPAMLRRGHGLGLAGARILARRLGGDVKVKSSKGKGATFQLFLPLSLESVESGESPLSEENGS